MTTALIIYLVASYYGAAILYAYTQFAPIGYEDETGFHYGEQPLDKIKLP